ncbi:hypothetical protein AGABI2DRAFT_194742, partial [Agaricus bisporus var. bisporus H97]|uniref:hypothetical protein n=1 Tax=Agaricus bisporus var. bisporus (strain H97 / ATCC MYA-4626 / FGSC 10389) TaxID=936046 RepID=UPI00029F65C2
MSVRRMKLPVQHQGHRRSTLAHAHEAHVARRMLRVKHSSQRRNAYMRETVHRNWNHSTHRINVACPKRHYIEPIRVPF